MQDSYKDKYLPEGKKLAVPKLIIADIDRTLRDRFTPIPGPETCEAFRVLHEKGILLGLASGRPLWQEVENHAKQWNLGFQFDFLLGLNGSEIKDTHTNTTGHYHYLTPESIKEIIENMMSLNDNPLIYKEGYELTVSADKNMTEGAKRHGTIIKECSDISELWAEDTAKILYRVDENKTEEIHAFARSFCNDNYTCFFTGPGILEFQSPAINKGEGLKIYCRDHNIAIEDTMAFGDAENDLQMMETAGTAVCVDNAMDMIKDVSDYITDKDAGHDGVGDFIFHHLDLN